MWIEENNKLHIELKFKDFKQAMIFINKMADIADELDHHPEFTNVYNKVNISLCTHSAGNIVTDKDRELAKRIDEIL
ncbi:MAG: 4a-hydroxytetrahydrobiopterin dehydratase [Saprospiraceae bacterium]|nr:4a-hydroxytetrahydrobiopterin dehydratase [Saprospiraceae bacterium]